MSMTLFWIKTQHPKNKFISSTSLWYSDRKSEERFSQYASLLTIDFIRHAWCWWLEHTVTVFPRIVSAETILFWIWSNWSKNMKVQKLFKGANYLRKYLIRMIKCIVNFGKNLEISTIVIPNYFLSNFKFDTCL